MSNKHYSFEKWCIDNGREDLLERWDYTLNVKRPSEVSFKSNEKYWFKCPSKRHESELSDIQYISSGRCLDIHCRKCDSFAQYIIDSYGQEYFEKIWDRSNEVDPWAVSKKSSKIAYFQCERKQNHIYPQRIYRFTPNRACCYCKGCRFSVETSLGVEVEGVLDVWSNKNIKNPYEYSSHTQEKVWWKCKKGLHKDYKRSITRSVKLNFRCPECGKEQSHKREKEDLTNQVFGELKAIYIDEVLSKKKKRTQWVCMCSCGEMTVVDVTNLKNGNTKSCGNRMVHYSGNNNGNWQGGITSELLAARTSTKYNRWRDEIYSRNWYTCQCCGKSHGINKEAHHISSFSNNKSLRYDLNNGILLCDKCHSAVIPGGLHYVYGAHTSPKQLEEYINNKRKLLGIKESFSLKAYFLGKIIKPNELATEQ